HGRKPVRRVGRARRRDGDRWGGNRRGVTPGPGPVGVGDPDPVPPVTVETIGSTPAPGAGVGTALGFNPPVELVPPSTGPTPPVIPGTAVAPAPGWPLGRE